MPSISLVLDSERDAHRPPETTRIATKTEGADLMASVTGRGRRTGARGRERGERENEEGEREIGRGTRGTSEIGSNTCCSFGETG